MSSIRVLKLVNTPIKDDPRVIPQAESLTKFGYIVSVIGIARETNGGQPVRDQINGIATLLLPMVSSNNPIRIIKALWQLIRKDIGITTEPSDKHTSNLISFVFFNMWLLRVTMKQQIEIVHCHDLLPLPAAWIIARKHHAQLIYDARESIPDLYTGTKGKILTRIEYFLLPRTNAVITVGERLAQALSRRGAPNITIIGNWKRLEDFQIDPNRIKLLRQQYALKENDLIIVFLGSLTSLAYDLIPLLEAVKEEPTVALFIGGSGDLRPIVVIAAEQYSNIHWLDWVSFNDLACYTQLSDVVYSCLKPDFPQAYYVAPNKLFEAFAAGKAIIARKGIGEIGDILEKIPAGILLDEVTIDSLKDAFEQLRDPLQLQKFQHAAEEGRKLYNWSIAEKRLKEIYDQLTKPH